MKQALFDKTIQPLCEYCSTGKPSQNSNTILCIKKGVMQKNSHCRCFSYDPLKRKPRATPELPSFDKAEFEI